MPVCITGMHRSGTSMVARLLNLCGLDLGPQDDLMVAAADNPAGFWENISFARINEKILQMLGGGWDFVPQDMKEGWHSDPVFNELRTMAKEHAIESFKNKKWGWKDPRSSITFPFWKSIFPDLKLVICLRNPLEVALSLRQRNNHSIAFGMHTWLKFNQTLLGATLRHNRMITNYEAYFHRPKRELKRILDWLDMEYSDETIENACRSISRSLKHNNVQIDQLWSSQVPPKVLTLYDFMSIESGRALENQEPTPFYSQIVSDYQKIQKLINTGKYEEAIAALRIHIQKYPHHALAHNNLGTLYFRAGKKDKALSHFKLSLQHDPKNLLVLNNLADVYFDLGNFQKACESYEKILSEKPEDIQILTSMGKAFSMLGRTEDALDTYEKILEFDPKNVIGKAGLEALNHPSFNSRRTPQPLEHAHV